MEDQQKDVETYQNLTAVLSAFNEYGGWAKKQLVEPRKCKYDALPEKQQALLPWFLENLEEIANGVDRNGQFFQQLAALVAYDWNVPNDGQYWSNCMYLDLEKLTSILSQIAREWSSECQEERNSCFGRILDALEHDIYGGLSAEEKAEVQVLVPGAGLGRLVLEIVLKGYKCQGNEFTYHMLLPSDYFLNKIESNSVESMSLSPFIHKFSHKQNRASQRRIIKVPDICPIDELIKRQNAVPTVPVQELMSIAIGSFVDIYGPNNPNLILESETYTVSSSAIESREANKEKFNVVVTCFFLDTSPNIVEYLFTIHNTLKKGGFWINFGPLLWHFENEDNCSDMTVKNNFGLLQKQNVPLKGLELSRDDLLQLCKDVGFQFVKRESNIKCTYGGDPESLGEWLYDCEFWIARKE